MTDVTILKDFDSFFYYGKGELEDEIAGDIQQILTQPKRTMLYSRSRNAAGIAENYPNTLLIKALLPFDIVTALSKRNLTTGNGQDYTKERRVAVSQNQVKISQNRSLLDVSVYYIPFVDMKQKNKAGFQMGIGSRG